MSITTAIKSPQANGPSRRTRVRKSALAASAMSAALLAGVGAPSAEAIPAHYVFSTPWTYYDGGCQAQTDVHYYPVTNRLQMKTSVRNPYWFADCKVNAKVYFDTVDDVVTDGPTQFAIGCAVFNPTCASNTFGKLDEFDPASRELQRLLRKKVDLSEEVTQIRVGFSKA